MTQRAPAMPPEERRKAIVEVAIPLLLRDGLEVKTTEIAAAAGIAEGTLFRAFPDKRALLVEIVGTVTDATEMEAAIAAIDRSLSLEDQVVAAIEIMQRKFVDVWRMLAAVGPRVPVPGPSNFPALTALLKPFASQLRRPPQQAALEIGAIVVATSMPAIYPNAPMAPNDIAMLALHGVAA